MKRTAVPLDPFRFGWRDVQQIGPDGSKHWVQVPLTQEEALHPQEGDHISENRQQGRDRRYLASVLELRMSGNPQALVLSDCLINWGIAGLGNHSPDISIFDGVRDPQDRNWGTFKVAVEGARPLLTIEIVSPDAHDRRVRDNDVVIKVREYYRAGVPLYVIVDQEREGGPRSLVGYRRGARKYVKLRPDRQGRLLLEPARLWVGLRDKRVVCWDADTGEEIPGFMATVQTLHEVQAILEVERQARLEAQAGRQAETQARLEAQAGRQAETQARLEAQAGRQAETQARLEAQAAREAETQAREAETRAREAIEAALAAAEARIRELEGRPPP